jgi:hypothetical protein
MNSSYWRIYEGTILRGAIMTLEISGRIIANRVVEYDTPLEIGKTYMLSDGNGVVGYSAKLICLAKAYPLNIEGDKHYLALRQSVDFEFAL